jgi:hypothetical protein
VVHSPQRFGDFTTSFINPSIAANIALDASGLDARYGGGIAGRSPAGWPTRSAKPIAISTAARCLSISTALSETIREERLLVPIELLRQHPSDAILLLRVGAVANAVLAMLRQFHALGMPPDVSKTAAELRRSVDRVHLFLTAIAQLNEGIALLQGKRIWKLVTLGETGEPQAALSGADPRRRFEQLRKLVDRLRNTMGAHVDPTVFKAWLQETSDSVVVLWHCAARKEPEQVFLGAGRVLLWEMFDRRPGLAEEATITKQLVPAMGMFVALARLALAGFFAVHGLNMRDYWQRRELSPSE